MRLWPRWRMIGYGTDVVGPIPVECQDLPPMAGTASGSGRMVRPYLGEKRDLNSRPLAPQTRALPTELFSPV